MRFRCRRIPLAHLTPPLALAGDVLVRGKRIVSVGEEISPQVLARARVIQGNGRTLMSGLCDAHTHFTWTNAGTLRL